YDTAVISGTTEAIQVFFISPMYSDPALAASNIAEFKIVSSICFCITALVFVFLFLKLFNYKVLPSAFASYLLAGIMGIILYDQYLSQNGVLNESLAMSIKGFIISSALFGCILGGGIAGAISQNFGRKAGM